MKFKWKNMSLKTQEIIMNILMWMIAIAVIVMLIAFSYQNWQTGKQGKDFSQICIDGHIYHTVNYGTKMAVAIKLTDEGKPIKCQ